MTPDIQAGDRPPACFGMTSDRTFYSFEEEYGRSVVLILAGADAVGDLAPVIGAFAAARTAFLAQGAEVRLLVDDNPRRLFPAGPPALPMVDCGDYLARCGVGAREGLLLALDRTMRVALRLRPDGQIDPVTQCLACLDRLPRDLPAPVLLLPNLLPPEVCQALIDRFETSPTIDGEVARIDASGVVRSVVDHRKKKRRDMPISPDDDLRDTLLRRCAPEIAKVFQANVAFTDRILVSRYDADGGWFRRHRDNAAPNVAFREFALSLNLNSGDYTGGHLLFPEYNDHPHAPPTGAGLIFSTSLLHEAAAVTQGSRYVLLTFFHGEAAEARRLAYVTAAPETIQAAPPASPDSAPAP